MHVYPICAPGDRGLFRLRYVHGQAQYCWLDGSSELSRSQFVVQMSHIELSVGESVRILREFQELSQNELADISGIPQSTISAIENDRVSLGVERAKTLARALKGHPAVLVFPGWDVEVESAA